MTYGARYRKGESKIKKSLAACRNFEGRLGNGERLDQDVGRLQIRGRTQGKAFLAVPALLSGEMRNEVYLSPGAAINKTNSVLLLDLSTVPYTETTMDTK